MKIIYYLTNSLLVLSALMGAANAIFNADNYIQQMSQLGYPNYLGYILAIFQLVGALVIGLSLLKIKLGGLDFLKEWAYAGFFINFTGAFLTHIFNQDGQFMASLVALVIFMMAYFSKKKLGK